MRCTSVRRQLLPYVEGSLPEDLSARVEEHISSCESCSREVDELARTVDVLRHTEYAAMEPASDLRGRVMERISNEPARKTWWSSRFPAYSAAAAAVLLFVIVFTTFDSGRVPIRWTEQPPQEIPMSTEQRKSDVSSDQAQPVPAESVLEPGKPESVAEVESTTAGETVTEDSEPIDKEQRRTVAGHLPKQPAISDVLLAPRYSATPKPLEGYGGLPPMSSADRIDNLYIAPAEGDRFLASSRYGLEPDSAGARIPSDTLKPDYEREHAVTLEPLKKAPETRLEAIFGYSMKQETKIEMGSQPSRFSTTVPFSVRAQAADSEKGFSLKASEDRIPSPEQLEKLLEQHRTAGRAKEEYEVAEQLTGLAPENARYWFARAEAAERFNMPLTAAASYRRAISLKLEEPQLRQAKSRLKILESEQD